MNEVIDKETGEIIQQPQGGLDKLAAALAKAQAKIRSAEKNQDNAFTKSRYADLDACWEACREPLSEFGLSVVQTTRFDGNMLFLITTLLHESGQSISGELPVLYNNIKANNTMQAMGSALTYARRYGLCAAVGVSPGDDDGNEAGNTTHPKQNGKVRLITQEELNALRQEIEECGLNVGYIERYVKKNLQVDSLENLPVTMLKPLLEKFPNMVKAKEEALKKQQAQQKENAAAH